MKPLTLLLFLFFCHNVLLSQEIVKTNKQWEGDQLDLPFGPVTPFNSKFRTSTKDIDGFTYRELMFKVEGGWFEGSGQYYREENNKVYKLYNGVERAILDFTLNVGDTMQVSNDSGENFNFIPYRTVDTIIQNFVRRKLEINAYPTDGSTSSPERHVWIEGVVDTGFFFGNGIVYNNLFASVVYCVKEVVYIYGAVMFCPNFMPTSVQDEDELIPDFYYDLITNRVHVKNEDIEHIDVYSINGVKNGSFEITEWNKIIDLGEVDLPLCVIVLFDGKTYRSKILRL